MIPFIFPSFIVAFVVIVLLGMSNFIIVCGSFSSTQPHSKAVVAKPILACPHMSTTFEESIKIAPKSDSLFTGSVKRTPNIALDPLGSNIKVFLI